jgi:hypothetical protein
VRLAEQQTIAGKTNMLSTKRAYRPGDAAQGGQALELLQGCCCCTAVHVLLLCIAMLHPCLVPLCFRK